MDNLETPYDEDVEFIECKVCEKSIRGDTLYKLHLTTPGHIKKEDVFVAAGLAVRKNTVPVFDDIVQYLDYMKLDEPIIGLDFLEELPCNDPQAGLRYSCRLCHQTANLQEMVRHVIGRKHRQKFVELKRPDLVTWDKQSIITQGGKIIRARAEIIERQDGRGTPVLIPKRGNEGKFNISRVPSRQKQNKDRNISQRETKRDVPSHIPRLMDINHEYSYQGRYPPGHRNTPSFHSEDPYMMNRDKQMNQRVDTHSYDGGEEELQRSDYSEGDMHRQEYMDSDYHREYEEEYVEDPQKRARLERDGLQGYNSSGEILSGHEDYFQDREDSHDRRQYTENDALKEFYSEETRRAEYQKLFSERNDHRRSLDREPGRRDSMNTAGWQGSSDRVIDPETKRRRFPTPLVNNQLNDHTLNIRDYCHGLRDLHHEEASANPGPSRTGPPNSQRQVEISRSMSDIPEPFRRFLKVATNDEGQGKRKRKSRFSDATAEEVESTKEMFSDEYGPSNPKFSGHPRSISAPLRPEIHEIQHHDHYTESQVVNHNGPHLREGYQRGSSESAGVFDMLKNIAIENAEEADFLKNKLCELLKEFKNKKSEMAGQSRAVMSKDCNSLKLDPELSPRHQYGTMLRGDSDHRQQEDLYFREDQRGRGWKQQDSISDKRFQEYHHPVRGETRHPSSNRNRYEEVFGQPEMSLTPPATYDEPAHYPGRFQESIHPNDYRAGSGEFFGLRPSAPPPCMERGSRMNRGSRYANNLDKITSTLLELVARK